MTVLAADWSMHSRAFVLVLIVALAMMQPQLHQADAQTATMKVALYAHTDTSAGGVLTLSSNATRQQYGDLRHGLNFTLIPSLEAPLHLLGSIDVYLWLRSQENVRGELRITMSEVRANGSLAEIWSASLNFVVPAYPYQVILGVGSQNHNLMPGSSLRLDVRFSPNATVPVMLLWDNPFTPTRVVVEVVTTPKVDMKVCDAAGTCGTISSDNGTNLVRLVARASIEDPFGGSNIRAASLTVANSTGFPLVDNEPMNLTATHAEAPFHLVYALPVAISSGRFNFTVHIVDAAKRVFNETRSITVTRFYTGTVALLDSKKLPVAGANVSFSAADWIESKITDSTGAATFTVPSSQPFVGPLSLQVTLHGAAVFSRVVNIESNETLQYQLPLYDWAIVVRFRFGLWNVPFPGPEMSLYLNGTRYYDSSRSDINGIAHFSHVLLGSYEIRAPLPEFLELQPNNVTLNQTDVTSSEDIVTTVTVVIPDWLIVLVGAAVVAVLLLVVFAASRRRRRARYFKHVADLFGGTIPRPAVIMVTGASGSGKSLLMQNILADSLQLGRRCVYISNSEMPSKIRDQLTKMGPDASGSEHENRLRFIDAYSGEVGARSSEKFAVASPRDLTGLGIQITRSVEELGGEADVYFDSLTPIVESGDPIRGLEFIRYSAARTTKSGGTFIHSATAATEPEVLSRLEELSDCVLQIEKTAGAGKIRGRILVKKARGLEHERDWVGFKITSKGRIEFVSLSSEKSRV